MDEGTLNDLLECSVCLDRLDTSSKVLPCQHTFCRKCLQEIYQKHKELRCPECRVLVTVKIEDLPPNVLLMRILEGMKNASAVATPPKKTPKHPADPSIDVLEYLKKEAKKEVRRSNRLANKHQAVMPTQPFAKALYDYAPKDSGDLCFKKGDIIILKRKIDAHWYQGECAGKQGVFPLSYVQIITPVPSHVPQCKALYDFRMSNDEEEGCLAFGKGDVINVIRRVDENWAEGKLDGRIGIFPLAFVEMNNLARSLMKLSTNVQPGPSKVAPPTPTTEDSVPLIPTDHTTSVTQIANNAASSSSSTTPNVSSSNTSSSSSTAPSSPASPPARPSPRNHHNKEKRHSLTNMTVPHHNNVHRHSAEIIQSASSSSSKLQLPATFMALYPYKPQKPDELELKKGGIYRVSEICQDGWYKGTSNRTQKCGVFPGNYVTPARGQPASDSVSKGARTRPSLDAAPPELPPRACTPPPITNKCDKSKERKEKGGLMKRLTSMKRPKSPPGSSYSMDNPVFEDATVAAPAHPVHVRSGSCPSQLLQLQPIEHRLFGSASHRVKHKERPSILTHSSRSTEIASSNSSPDVHRHHKSQSLDATKHPKSTTQNVHERFRCTTPYPPNSEYELELQINDIIYVHKKREDGWYKGTQQRTGKTGLFPASFVEGF
ncbi:unnamed protein product [Ceutorhynchus assimilis]|uniref:RING-type E3 ubiquitin transferase n=1 Tax=Ceutorhynchus assimilis TaxID=467358 RepID=A0A9N9MD41_9CUCU|nr:unnamed protein product [Ceutorhynchus assimilis]